MEGSLYLDNAASEEQRVALSKIFSGQSGGFFAPTANFIGEMLGIKSAPITFGMEGKRRWLHIPDYLNLKIEAIKGGDQNKDSMVTNPAFTVAPGYDPVISRSTKHTYKILGLNGTVPVRMVSIQNSTMGHNSLLSAV